jgi:dTDP-4-amino-4,6-dideoxygalactose transaminase
VGTFGDIGIISFGKEKICFGLGGGAVLSPRNSQVGDLAARLLQPTVLPTLQNLFSALLWRCWRRWTLPLQQALSPGYSPSPDAPAPAYRKETMANLNAAVALTLMQTLNENIAARRARVGLYRELLGDVGELELIAHRPGSAALAQVIRIAPKPQTEDVALAAVDALGNAGYEVQGSYVPLHQLAGCAMCVWDRSPYADRVWADLIELPCEPGVTLEQVEQIAHIIKATIRS